MALSATVSPGNRTVIEMTIEIKRSPCGVSRPKLTVGIPTWNRAGRLGDQLSRLAGHLTLNIELVVIDNRSNDETWEGINQFISSHPGSCITAIRNGSNLGADENYLRIIEAASGEWVWLVGDDDPIDFAILPDVMRRLIEVSTPLALLVDTGECSGLMSSDEMKYLSPAEFFQPNADMLGLQLLQVGRVLCRTDLAQTHLRRAHSVAVGDLHAYASVYGTLTEEYGLTALCKNLLRDCPVAEGPRWNLLSGHIGAWKSSVIAFPAHGAAASAREQRLRQGALLSLVVQMLAAGRRLAAKDRRWMLRVFTPKGRFYLLSILIAFSFSRRLAVSLLLLLFPAQMKNILSSVPASGEGY